MLPSYLTQSKIKSFFTMQFGGGTSTNQKYKIFMILVTKLLMGIVVLVIFYFNDTIDYNYFLYVQHQRHF